MMKTSTLSAFLASALAVGPLLAQNPADSLVAPVAASAEVTSDLQIPDLQANAAPSGLPSDLTANTDFAATAEEPSDLPPPPPSPGGAPADPAGAPTAPFAPLEQQKQDMEKSDEGYIIKDAGLNDIFQFLAKSAGRQYFHNSKIAGPEFLVTGHLNDGNPLMQMEELAFMYGLSLHTKGNTIYALTQAQLSQLPSAEFHYQLRYLRPNDMEQIKELIKPLLNPATGVVNFEPKTNTIVIIDSPHRIEQAQQLLHGIDKAKGQIIVETKILRVNSSVGEKLGVNWTSDLGTNGVPLELTGQIGNLFGLPTSFTDSFSSPASPGAFTSDHKNIVLAPAQITGLLRALNQGGLASQISNPTLITEDNEQATISIIDRIPIITTTSTQATSGGNPTVTEEVRYKIDTSDVTIDTNPDKHREIGISLVVTPTLLPDGTVRMKMRPRNAQITGTVEGVTGNKYPSVTESMVESLARVPDGHSLVVGGFYGETKVDDKTKVPLFGDIPVLNFFFKSKEASKERTSLVFIVTPTSYDPTSHSANRSAQNRIHASTNLDCESTWIDPENPGPAHEPNLKRAVRGLQPTEAPYYPRADELQPKEESRQSSSSSSNQSRFARAKR